jgi:hypothetical protein
VTSTTIVKLPASILLSVIFALYAPVIFAQAKMLESEFAGEYITGHEFGGGTITLKADGTFEQHDGSDDGTEATTTGTFRIEDSKLIFSISKSIGRNHRDDGDFDLLNPKERQKFFMDPTTTIIKTFSMFPILWSERIYLLEESDLKLFADAVNMGIEPRNALHSWAGEGSPWMGSFFLRSGDQKKKASGPPPLPEPWRDMLLQRPVSGKLIRIDKVERVNDWDDEYTATINRGQRNGLKTGMKLIMPGHGDPSPWDGPEVISVKQTTAQVKGRFGRNTVRVGDVISSRFRQQNLFR